MRVTVRRLVHRVRAAHKRPDQGASAVEYGLLVALIALVIAGTVFAVGAALRTRFSQAERCFDTTNQCIP